MAGFKVGRVAVPGQALLAPMAGVTDLGMRRIAARRGAALAFSEMVAADDFLRGGEESHARAEMAGVGLNAAQIVGCEAGPIVATARILEDAGVDIIDINMGCPARRVAGRLAGAAFLKDLDAAERVISETASATTVPVTVKTRLGWDEQSENVVEFALRAERAGAAMITVHARTRCQFYEGAADWTKVAAVTQAVRIPVVVNGDCRSLKDAKAMLAASGAQAVMIGRAALGAPWLVGAISEALATGAPLRRPAEADRRDDAIEHLQSLLAAMGARAGLRHARKHLAAYAEHEGADRDLRRELVTTDDPAIAERALLRVFEFQRAAAA